MSRVSIIIPTWNLVDYLRECLSKIVANTTTGLTYEIIVVDNGSTDATPEFLGSAKLAEILGRHATKGLQVITNETNLGYGPACNQGIDAAGGEVLCFLNNDVEVTPGWLPGLLRYMDDPVVGAVGPMSNNVSGPQNVATNEYVPTPYPLPLHRLVGHCLLVRKSILDEIGGFDTRFKNAFEDDDLSMRIYLKRKTLLAARDVFVFHHGSATFRTYPETLPYDKILKENHQLFLDKWKDYVKGEC